MANRFGIQKDPPSEKVKQIAEKELRETPEVAAAAIKELKQLIKG